MIEDSPKLLEIIDSIHRVYQVVNEQSKRAEKESGITGPQLWAIKTIADAAPIKGAELARRMYLHPTTIVGILDRLEARGFVVRTRSKLDRRIVEVDLTEQGKSLVACAPQVAQGMLVKGLETLPQDRLSRISDGLEELVRILGAKDLAPRLILSAEVNLPERGAGEQTCRSDSANGPPGTD